MSPLIAFLDILGRQPGVDIDAALERLDLDAATRAALRARDPAAVTRAFGARTEMWCKINTPEDEPQPAEEPPGDAPDDRPDDRPDRDPDR
jgi:hypothetical protein